MNKFISVYLQKELSIEINYTSNLIYAYFLYKFDIQFFDRK